MEEREAFIVRRIHRFLNTHLRNRQTPGVSPVELEDLFFIKRPETHPRIMTNRKFIHLILCHHNPNFLRPSFVSWLELQPGCQVCSTTTLRTPGTFIRRSRTGMENVGCTEIEPLVK